MRNTFTGYFVNFFGAGLLAGNFQGRKKRVGKNKMDSGTNY